MGKPVYRDIYVFQCPTLGVVQSVQSRNDTVRQTCIPFHNQMNAFNLTLHLITNPMSAIKPFSFTMVSIGYPLVRGYHLYTCIWRRTHE